MIVQEHKSPHTPVQQLCSEPLSEPIERHGFTELYTVVRRGYVLVSASDASLGESTYHS